MQNNIQIVVGWIILLTLCSCKNTIEPKMDKVVYFDMQKFILSEIENLNKKEKILEKIIYANDSVDTLIIQQPDWQNELQIFSAGNINKSTLYETYSVDTNANVVQYQSLKSKNKVESLIVIYATDNLEAVSKIIISKSQKNFINQSSEALIYQPILSWLE